MSRKKWLVKICILFIKLTDFNILLKYLLVNVVKTYKAGFNNHSTQLKFNPKYFMQNHT